MMATYLAPSLIRLGVPPWALGVSDALQAWIWSVAFLLISVVWLALARRPSGFGVVGAVLVALACWAAAYVFLDVRPDVTRSRIVAALSVSIGSALAVLPFILGRWLAPATAVLATGVVIGGSVGIVRDDAPRPGIEQFGTVAVNTALLPLQLTYQDHSLNPTSLLGGALVAIDDDFLLATGAGSFYRLRWSSDTQLEETPLSLTLPIDRSQVPDTLVDLSSPFLRVTGMAVDTLGDGLRLFVAHESWDDARDCVTLNVSTAHFEMEDAIDAPTRFDTLFVSEPCVTPATPFNKYETGGRLTRQPDGTLLLTLGDFGFSSGAAPTAQDPGGDYGKILVIRPDGSHAEFTRGHRNPQGIAVDHLGRVWETEHGPRGGDELNLLSPGANYGWPVATYGTEYGAFRWRPGVDSTTPSSFTEPVYAFVPSIGISNLIQVRDPAFGPWQHDLLIASLGRNDLFRVRLTGTRVAYVEPIGVSGRIRDLAEGTNGRIVLWTDEGVLIVVAPATGEFEGSLAYELCSRCHHPERFGTLLGPALLGVVDRDVASGDFAWSDALRRLGGRWTEERLNAFLRNPAAFAPGTNMAFEGIPDESTRRALIAFLRTP